MLLLAVVSMQFVSVSHGFAATGQRRQTLQNS